MQTRKGKPSRHRKYPNRHAQQRDSVYGIIGLIMVSLVMLVGCSSGKSEPPPVPAATYIDDCATPGAEDIASYCDPDYRPPAFNMGQPTPTQTDAIDRALTRMPIPPQ